MTQEKGLIESSFIGYRFQPIKRKKQDVWDVVDTTRVEKDDGDRFVRVITVYEAEYLIHLLTLLNQ